MMKVLSALVALVIWTPLCLAFPAEDLVDDLPGYGKPPTTQYSGYCDDIDENEMMDDTFSSNLGVCHSSARTRPLFRVKRILL